MSRRITLAATITMTAALGGACGYDGAASGTPGVGDGGRRDAGPTRTESPRCDPLRDPACLALPSGWSFVAAAFGPGSGPRSDVPCPAGFDAPNDVGEGPTPAADACVCSTCNVMNHGSCVAGAIITHFSVDNSCGNPGAALLNEGAGQCLPTQQPPEGARNTKVKLTPPPTVPGTCLDGPAEVHADRVSYATKGRLCRDATRCSGGTCDSPVDPPYRACIAHDALNAQCPADFADRHVVGVAATFDCAACTGCLTSTTCTASTDFFTDAACANGKVSVLTDDGCRPAPFSGTYQSYRYTGVAKSTCAASSASVSAKNPRVTPARVVCCR